MPQQINLLCPGLRRQRTHATLQQGALLLGLLVLACLIGSAALQWLARQTEQDLQRLQQAMDQRRVQLLAATAPAGHGERSTPDQLEAELRSLRQFDAAQRRVQSVLASGQAGRSEGHAAVLLALARQADPAVWLTGLQLGQDSATLELQGRMADAAALPDYLRRLQNEALFHGRQFAQLSLRRVEADADGNAAGGAYTEFVLRTQLGAPAAGAKP